MYKKDKRYCKWQRSDTKQIFVFKYNNEHIFGIDRKSRMAYLIYLLIVKK